MQGKKTPFKIIYCIIILALIAATDIWGMIFLLDLSLVDAVFYTVTTVATVGYEAPPNLTVGGKLFLVWVMVTGFGVIGYAIGQLAQYTISERMLLIMGRRKNKALEKLNNHWILCGAGRVGEQVAMHFIRDGVPFVAIESDEGKSARFVGEGWNVITGDASDEDILIKARIDKAAGLIASLSDDADNVYVTLCAKSLNANLRIIARATNVQSTGMLYRAGAEKVINPIVSGADAIASAAVKPKVAEFFHSLEYAAEKLDLEFNSIKISINSIFCGKNLAEANIRNNYGALVLAIKREDENEPTYSPPGNFVLEAGNELLALVKREHTKDFQDAATMGFSRI